MPTEIKPISEHVDLLHNAISPRFGSEVQGINLLDMTDDEVAALKQLGAERGVLVIRDQVMTMAHDLSGEAVGWATRNAYNSRR